MVLLSGYVKNTSGQPIPFASVTLADEFFDDIPGQGTAANAAGFFSFYADPDLMPYYITATSVGYIAGAWPIEKFQSGSTLTLKQSVITLDPVVVTSTTQKPFPIWLLAIPLVIAATSDKKKGNSISGIGKVDTNNVLLIGGGLIGLTIVNKLLVSLGISRGQGGQAVISEQTNPNSPWKPAYYKALPTGTQYYTLTETGGNQFSATIYKAFTLFKDNFDQIMSVFGQLQTKTQVSVLAEYFKNNYNRDLLTFLTDGGGILPWDGLSDNQLKTVTDYVNNLPATWP